MFTPKNYSGKILFAVLLFTFQSFCSTVKAQYTDLVNFNKSSFPSGANPQGSLILSGTSLYGVTLEGGVGFGGIIFCVQTDGTGYTYLIDFDYPYESGWFPEGSPVLSGDTLYGMTNKGGRYDGGVVYSVKTNGTGYSELCSFDSNVWIPNADNPWGSLILSGTILYGMVYNGGPIDAGFVFSLQTNGTGYTHLVNFNDTSAPQGAHPTGSLILSGTTLYGMTGNGGVYGHGVIFSVQTNGTGYADLWDFNNISIGAGPAGSLILSGSTLYGMTEGGGANGKGVIFSIQTNGTGYTDLLDFNNTSYAMGAYPEGDLILSGNTLYGMTMNGGAKGFGVVFSVKTNGTRYADLWDFDSATGEYPRGSLILSGNSLYGMTGYGGANGDGVIFKVDTNDINSINKVNTNPGTVSIFPNPNNGVFAIQANSTGYSAMANNHIEIYNVLGEEVYQSYLKAGISQISLYNPIAGVYFYRVVSECRDLIASGKILVE